MDAELNQKSRLLILIGEVAILLFFSWLAFGSFLPPTGDKGFWFYTAVLSLVMGTRLLTPYYAKPVDAISYAVPALIAICLVNDWSNWPTETKYVFVFCATYCSMITVAGFVQILTKDSTNTQILNISNGIRLAINVLSPSEVIYSTVLIFAIVAFHRESASEIFWIFTAAAVTVAFSPVKGLISLVKKIASSMNGQIPPDVIGTVLAYQTPKIVLFRQLPKGANPFGSLRLIRDTDTHDKVVIVLDEIGRNEGVVLRALEFEVKIPELLQRQLSFVPNNSVVSLQRSVLEQYPSLSSIHKSIDSLVGLVVADSSVERLHFEVISEAEIQEGRLVEIKVGGLPVLYQVVNGLTREEIVHQKNTYGFVRAQAQKIGIWDEPSQSFKPAKWVPQINSPVHLAAVEDQGFEIDAIGVFPRTKYGATLKSLPDLVTHNTAILGILGVGKSSLAFELIERMLADGIKVICLDLTDEYSDELKEFCYDYENDALYQQVLGTTGAAGKRTVHKNVEEGGNKPKFAHELTTYLEKFINGTSAKKLLVFNPAQYEVWRQDSKPYADTASMASLSPTEITQLFTEAALAICQRMGKVEKGMARVCLVYEEAHSLVPEWNTVVNEGDKAAVNGTARAILQGRKFGLGCLLISQRTANVTKTILNQCNTIFAMRTYDDTGKDFISNYIGKDYAATLSSIEERHAVLFGKASNCAAPILIRLNDRQTFKNEFRLLHGVPEEEPSPSIGACFEDDIPF